MEVDLLEIVTKHKQIKCLKPLRKIQNTPVRCCIFPVFIWVCDLRVEIFIVPDVGYETEYAELLLRLERLLPFCFVLTHEILLCDYVLYGLAISFLYFILIIF